MTSGGQGGEIRAVMFNDVIDLHDAKLEEGKVYSLTRGTIKSARRQYNNLNSDYEITLERSSLIEGIECVFFSKERKCR